MERTVKKRPSLTLLVCICCSTAYAQAKSGVENYNFLNRDKTFLWMPVVHYQSGKGIYAELRYNYEDVNTVSLFCGKTIAGGNNLRYSLSPMAGFSAGQYTGTGLACNAEAACGNFFVSSQLQYCKALKKECTNFFFSWSEAGYSFLKIFFAGAALQYTLQAGLQAGEPGLLAGFNFGNISVPFYLFNPFRADQYLVIGINYEYHLKKNK